MLNVSQRLNCARDFINARSKFGENNQTRSMDQDGFQRVLKNSSLMYIE